MPGFWFPIVVGAIFGFGTLYWSFFQILQLRWGGRSVGERVGFEVAIYNEDDNDVPENMRNPMLEAQKDGSRHRMEYKVRLVPKQAGELAFNDFK